MFASRPNPASSRPLILLSANSAWNIANFRLGLIRALKADGYDVVAAAPADGHEAKLVAEGLRFECLPIDRSGMNAVTDLQLLARYRQLMRNYQPTAYLGFTIKPNIYGSLAARLAGVPAINNISGLGTMFLGHRWKSMLAHALYRVGLQRSGVVFFQNPEDRDLFVEGGTVRAERARLLPGSGIDLERYMPVGRPPGPPTFLFIGRLLADKGIREFVHAAELIRERKPEARFEIVGGTDPGNRTAIASDEIEVWRAAGHVTLLGETADVRPHIARATAVVLPSYREGLPRVLLEASAMGRPMIASDVPGCRSIVRHEESGLLCMVRDSRSLADAMLRLMEMTPAEQEAMGQSARRVVEEEFGERHVIGAYLAALRDIGAGSRVGTA